MKLSARVSTVRRGWISSMTASVRPAESSRPMSRTRTTSPTTSCVSLTRDNVLRTTHRYLTPPADSTWLNSE